MVLVDNPRHRRAKLIRMTDGGREAYQGVMSAWTPDAQALEERVGIETARILARGMTNLAEAFRAIADRRGRITAPTSTNREEPQS